MVSLLQWSCPIGMINEDEVRILLSQTHPNEVVDDCLESLHRFKDKFNKLASLGLDLNEFQYLKTAILFKNSSTKLSEDVHVKSILENLLNSFDEYEKLKMNSQMMKTPMNEFLVRSLTEINRTRLILFMSNEMSREMSEAIIELLFFKSFIGNFPLFKIVTELFNKATN